MGPRTPDGVDPEFAALFDQIDEGDDETGITEDFVDATALSD